MNPPGRAQEEIMNKKEAIEKALKELQNMSEEDLAVELEKARQSDLYKMLERASEELGYADNSETIEDGSCICHKETG